MQLSKLVQVSTFRLTLLNLLVFGVSTVIPFGFVYTRTVGAIDGETNAGITAEIRALEDEYARVGLAGFVDVLAERAHDPGDKDAVYLLANTDLTRLAGNILSWPTVPLASGQWATFEIEKVEQGEVRVHTVRARVVRLERGEWLLVGRDIHERRVIQHLITGALGWALAITLGLGVTGGIVMSRYMLRRVDAIAQTSRMIIEGRLSRRMPVRGTGDEFDRLSESLNAMLDQIEQLMTSMRTVTDSIAHDLRGPLTHLKGRIELALHAPPDPKSYRAALETAVAETDRILAVFNALIEVARAESGLARETMEAVDLGLVAEDVFDLYEPVAEQRGLTLAADIASRAVIMGNRHLLAQAVANLLDNAIKYTPRGGAIRLSVAAEESDKVRLRVCDNGPGIPEGDRGRALERFVRLPADPAVPGSGLGLSLVAAVARLHRATLELGDNAPGLDATIVFPAGPVAPPFAERTATAPAAAAAAAAGG